MPGRLHESLIVPEADGTALKKLGCSNADGVQEKNIVEAWRNTPVAKTMKQHRAAPFGLIIVQLMQQLYIRRRIRFIDERVKFVTQLLKLRVRQNRNVRPNEAVAREAVDLSLR